MIGVDISEKIERARVALRGSDASQPPSPETIFSNELLPRFVRLTNIVRASLSAQRRAVNGVHPSTYVRLSEWLEFFSAEMWKKSEFATEALEVHRPVVTTLLTLCVRLGVIAPLASSSVSSTTLLQSSSSTALAHLGDSLLHAPPPPEALVLSFVREHAAFLDMDAVLVYFLQRGFSSAGVSAVCAVDADVHGDNESRLALRSHLGEGSSERAFALLEQKPSNQTLLIVEFLGELVSLDAARATDLLVGAYPRVPPHLVRSHAAAGVYLTYLNRLLGTSGSAKARRDEDVATECLCLNLREHGVSLNVWQDDGAGGQHPSRGSLGAWGANGRWMRVLIDKCAIREEEALQACLRAGYWDGAMLLLERAGRHADAVTLALWADDKKWWVKLAPLCAGVAAWRAIIKQFELVRRSRQGQPSTISAADGAFFLVSFLGY